MTQSLGIGFAIVAALTTASSHALLKAGEDQAAVRALCGATWAAVAAVPLAILGPPAPAMLPWLAGAVILHSVYSMLLTRSYTLNDFSVAFPIARGTAPVIATAAGVLLFGEIPGLGAMAGVIAISAGIVSLSAGGGIGRAGLIAALGAGVLTAAYTVVDAGGMRVSNGVLPFLCWFFFATGLALMIQARLSAGPDAGARMRRNLRPGVAAGLLAIVSFGSTLVALRYAPVATVSALRETCILVSILIAWAGLKERVTLHSLTAAIVIATGTLLLLLSHLSPSA
ncbi:DMT family transporter [Sphingopyxis sp. PET50]|uniref:DMT family transporter n=1 Tax=Sphingopyxis sp. PET50 TaxID=2976533 RepID=UPI0021AF51AC|nr:DMT family transporter [Sphingopyxis sp. PET50]